MRNTYRLLRVLDDDIAVLEAEAKERVLDL